MSKAWIIFGLILLILAQLIALSLFHDVDQNGFSVNNSVITVAKWNYVDASVTISIFPMVENGTANATLILPNGTSVNLTTPVWFTQRFNFPRSGDFIGSEAVSGPVPLSQDEPLNVVINSEVADVPSYIASLSSSGFNNIDFLNFIVYGETQILVSAYGVVT